MVPGITVTANDIENSSAKLFNKISFRTNLREVLSLDKELSN